MVRIGKRRISPRKFALILSDLILTVIALRLAIYLHLAVPIANAQNQFTTASVIMVVVGIFVFQLFGYYSHIWRFASLTQYFQLLIGTIVQTCIGWGIMMMMANQFSPQVYIIYNMLIFLFATGTRVAYRALMNSENMRANLYRQFPAIAKTAQKATPKSRRMIVIGAGVTGSQMIREMQQHSDIYEPVAIIDDNPLTHTYRVMGVPVFGGRESIPEAVLHYQADGIVLAIPNAPRKTIRDFVDICNKTGCHLKTLPVLKDLIDGKVSINDIKNVEIEDLLGRAEIVLDTSEIANYLEDEVVLITGGGGSIGSELCRQIARFKPKQMIIFDIYENNAYQLQYELKGLYGNDLNLLILIGSVRDKLRLMKIFEAYRPGVVFHAAAHKHVPLMEDSPGEAVKNNIIGTYNVAEVAAKSHVKRFVLISTDKAVNPTNVMGASKRLAEMIIQTLSTAYPKTRFAAVRFGNVLGSNGSVIPLFKQQIANERRVTVTHPDITRYFMTIPEAARLVIQAGAQAIGGEIFVLDMGEPVKIDDLARDLIRLSGLEPEVDVRIEYTGLRPGEKMFEELFQAKESMNNSRHSLIYTLKPICDRAALETEVADLRRLIQWENPLYRELMDWVLQNFHIAEPTQVRQGSGR